MYWQAVHEGQPGWMVGWIARRFEGAVAAGIPQFTVSDSSRFYVAAQGQRRLGRAPPARGCACLAAEGMHGTVASTAALQAGWISFIRPPVQLVLPCQVYRQQAARQLSLRGARLAQPLAQEQDGLQRDGRWGGAGATLRGAGEADESALVPFAASPRRRWPAPAWEGRHGGQSRRSRRSAPGPPAQRTPRVPAAPWRPVESRRQGAGTWVRIPTLHVCTAAAHRRPTRVRKQGCTAPPQRTCTTQ